MIGELTILCKGNTLSKEYSRKSRGIHQVPELTLQCGEWRISDGRLSRSNI